MKLYKNILGIAITATLVLSGNSCTDDLDIERLGVFDMNTFYQTDEQALEAITNCYTKVADLRCHDLLLPLSDDIWAGGSTRGDQAASEQLNEFRFGTENANIKSAYQNLYSIIYAANLVINKVDADTPAKRQYIAEARCFRAYAYFMLTTLWGDIPLITDCFEEGDYARSRNSADEIKAQIVEDYTTAINSGDLTEKSSAAAGTESIHITQQTAQALMAKYYLFQKDYGNARTLLQQVINSGKYALADCTVGELFQAPQNCNCEAMLFYNNVADVNDHGFEFLVLGPNIRNDMFNELTGNWYMGTGNLFWIGFGYYNPQRALYDAFVAYGEEEGTRLSSTLLTTEQLCEKEHLTLAAGMTTPGNDGVWNWKNHADRTSYVEGSFGGFYNNHIVLRYADVLLMMAECEINLSGAGAGDTYVNEVRQRSGLSPKTGVTMDELKNEWRFEFALEEHRYLDLLRWGDCATVQAKQGEAVPNYHVDAEGNAFITWNEFTNPGTGWRSKHAILPIPQAELDVNKNIEQTEAWK